jgi:LmbE family N-acetylglucosaminyl deacetylase
VPARLLGIFTDPLEASLLCGGTLARYAASGIETALTFAAEVEPEPALAAARALGVRHLFLLGLGAQDLAQPPAASLSADLADLMRAVEAQVVITPAPGIDGRPEAGLELAAWSAFLEVRQQAGSGRRPVRLYQASLPRRQARALLPLLPSAAAGWSGGASDGAGMADSGLTTVVDARAWTEAKLAALSAAAPRLDLSPFDPALLSYEFFRRAYPEPWVSGVLERDLLAGIADRGKPAAPPARQAV